MRRRGEAGLTLVEMLVVLAIIGIIGGATALSLGRSGSTLGAQVEARRLARSIQLAADEALVTDRRLALRWDAAGYSFVEWDGARGAWEPRREGALAVRHELETGTSLSGADDLVPFPIGDGTGMPTTFTLRDDSQGWRVEFDGLTAAAVPGDSG